MGVATKNKCGPALSSFFDNAFEIAVESIAGLSTCFKARRKRLATEAIGKLK
jgi:hypothetical protein